MTANADTSRDLADRLVGIQSDFDFIQQLRSASNSAAEGDAIAIGALELLVNVCDATAWEKKGRFCAAVFSALMQTRTMKSQLLTVKYLKELPDNVPFGAVELFASHLPIYGTRILPSVRDLAQSQGEAVRAVGIQALCNLYLDGKIQDDDETFLLDLLAEVSDDRYSSGHLAELVRAHIKARDPTDQELVLNAILVEPE